MTPDAFWSLRLDEFEAMKAAIEQSRAAPR